MHIGVERGDGSFVGQGLAGGNPVGVWVVRLAAITVVWLCLPGHSNGQTLFDGEPKHSHVRQGRLGTCHFHAVMAVAAHRRPALLTSALKETLTVPIVGETLYELTFADGSTEYVLKDDVIESRKQGFDVSTGGLWVAAAMRGFAQAILRAAIAKSIDRQADIPDAAKLLAKTLVHEDRILLQAYDAVVRGAVDPTGNIDQGMFRKNLKAQLERVLIPTIVADVLVDLASDTGFLAALEDAAKQNGDLFGVYRSVGNGGFPVRAVSMLFGMKCTILSTSTHSGTQLLQKIEDAHSNAGLTMAATGASHPGQKPSWFVPNHAYAVLATDGGKVVIRNPWSSTTEPFELAPDNLKIGFESVDVCK